jgi:hypothetical protein
MIELLDVLAGGLLMAVGFVWGGRRRRKALPVAGAGDPEATCGCGHHDAPHDESRRCRHVDMVNSLAERSGRGDVRWDVRELECRCQRYTGPEPLPLYLP